MTKKKSKLNCPYCNHPSSVCAPFSDKLYRVLCSSGLCLAGGPSEKTEDEAKRKFGNRIQNYLELVEQCLFCGKGKFKVSTVANVVFFLNCVNCDAVGPQANTEEEARERIKERP